MRDIGVTRVQTDALPISGHLRELKAASHALAAHQAEAKAAVDATKAVERRMVAVRKTIEAKVARQARLVSSEVRRVGKECRSRWWPYHEKKSISTPRTTL